MSRKDMILVSVVINAGLLAMLFITAVIYDPYEGVDQPEGRLPIVENKQSFSDEMLIATAPTGDEVDNVLKYYTAPSSMPIEVLPLSETSEADQKLTSHSSNEESFSSSQEKFIEVKVKQGDRLEKIARANMTTVGAIKRANGLESERLSIGQVLKIPVKQKSVLMSGDPVRETGKPPKKEKKHELKMEKELFRESEQKSEQPKFEAIKAEQNSSDSEKIEKNEPVYYIIKSGDNPWKIAKQFNVRYDEILRLNQMSEEKARNLKIGDRIRVK